MAIAEAGIGGPSLSSDLGGVPSAGDTVVIRDGSAAYSSGLDLSSVELDTFRVNRDFSGTLGAPGSSVQLDLSAATYTGDLIHDSAGDFAYYAAVSEIQRAQILRAGVRGVNFTAGTVTLLEVFSGVVNANDQTDVIALSMSGGAANIDTHASQTLDTANLIGTASVICKRNVGTVTIGPRASLAITEDSATATSITVDGVLRYGGGTIGTLIARTGSTVDFSTLRTDLTITNSTIWPGVNFIAPPPGVTITYTNTPTLVLGGTPRP